MPQTVAQVGNKRQTQVILGDVLGPGFSTEMLLRLKCLRRGPWVMLSAFLSLPALLVAPSSCDEGFKGGCCLFPGQLHVPCVRGVPGQVLSSSSASELRAPAEIVAGMWHKACRPSFFHPTSRKIEKIKSVSLLLVVRHTGTLSPPWSHWREWFILTLAVYACLASPRKPRG